MSRLAFEIVWDSDPWASSIGDLLRKPMYLRGRGHSMRHGAAQLVRLLVWLNTPIGGSSDRNRALF